MGILSLFGYCRQFLLRATSTLILRRASLFLWGRAVCKFFWEKPQISFPVEALWNPRLRKLPNPWKIYAEEPSWGLSRPGQKLASFGHRAGDSPGHAAVPKKVCGGQDREAKAAEAPQPKLELFRRVILKLLPLEDSQPYLRAAAVWSRESNSLGSARAHFAGLRT